MEIRVDAIALHGRWTSHNEPSSRFEVNQTVMNGIYYGLNRVLGHKDLHSRTVPLDVQERLGLQDVTDGLLSDRRELFVLDDSFLILNGHIKLPDGQLRNIVRVSALDSEKSAILIHTLREIEPERYSLWKEKSYFTNIRCDCFSEITQLSKHNNNAYKPMLSK